MRLMSIFQSIWLADYWKKSLLLNVFYTMSIELEDTHVMYFIYYQAKQFE